MIDESSGSSGSALVERRVLLRDVPWSTYVVLRDTVGGASRMTYLEGQLEIMSPSPAHETLKKMVARLLELFCLERDIPLYGYGSTTFRNEAARRGLEPDECYTRGTPKDAPDLAIEVIVSSGLLDKLDVYRGLRVAEVWLVTAAGLTVQVLRDGQYHEATLSSVFPEVDLAQLLRFATVGDQHQAVLQYRAELRQLAH
jgi:Uma2 family endonuclease